MRSLSQVGKGKGGETTAGDRLIIEIYDCFRCATFCFVVVNIVDLGEKHMECVDMNKLFKGEKIS